MFDLIVTQPFGEHAKGDKITDQAHAAEILGSSQRHHVVKVARADPAPAKTAEKPAAPDTPKAAA